MLTGSRNRLTVLRQTIKLESRSRSDCCSFHLHRTPRSSEAHRSFGFGLSIEEPLRADAYTKRLGDDV
jgi:hypothetical protein